MIYLNILLNYLPFLVDLVGLLRWRQHKRKIPEVLDSLVKVCGDEIMKVSVMQSCIVFYQGSIVPEENIS